VECRERNVDHLPGYTGAIESARDSLPRSEPIKPSQALHRRHRRRRGSKQLRAGQAVPAKQGRKPDFFSRASIPHVQKKLTTIQTRKPGHGSAATTCRTWPNLAKLGENLTSALPGRMYETAKYHQRPGRPRHSTQPTPALRPYVELHIRPIM